MLSVIIALSVVLTAASAQYSAPSKCEYSEGVQSYPDPSGCDRYYLCTNGTLTQGVCENGLLYSGKGAVHEHCDYNWRVDCGDRKHDQQAKGGACPYDFGIFPSGEGCADYFVKCIYGEVQPELCEEGLAYDEASHSCNWPDLLPQCSVGDAEQLVGYSCPEEIPAGSASLRFAPFPRFATGECDRLVTCVNYYPRLTKCGEGKAVDENSLTCVDAELVQGCGGYGRGPVAGPGPVPSYGPVQQGYGGF